MSCARDDRELKAKHRAVWAYAVSEVDFARDLLCFEINNCDSLAVGTCSSDTRVAVDWNISEPAIR